MKQCENIYANVDGDVSWNQRGHAGAEARGQRPIGTPGIEHSGTGSPERSHFRAAVCLGLLCVLLLAGIIGLGVYNIRVKEAKTRVTAERDQLQTTLNTLTKKRDVLKRRLCESNDGWVKSGCSYYYVSTEKKTWEESREDCRSRGADLVVINNKDEQVFLLTNLTNKSVWIGLTDIDEEGTWTWVDGTPLTTTYWQPRQPDNHGGPSKEGEDCAETHPYNQDSLNKWNDNVCGKRGYWICEQEI